MVAFIHSFKKKAFCLLETLHGLKKNPDTWTKGQTMEEKIIAALRKVQSRCTLHASSSLQLKENTWKK